MKIVKERIRIIEQKKQLNKFKDIRWDIIRTYMRDGDFIPISHKDMVEAYQSD